MQFELDLSSLFGALWCGITLVSLCKIGFLVEEILKRLDARHQPPIKV